MVGFSLRTATFCLQSGQGFALLGIEFETFLGDDFVKQIAALLRGQIAGGFCCIEQRARHRKGDDGKNDGRIEKAGQGSEAKHDECE